MEEYASQIKMVVRGLQITTAGALADKPPVVDQEGAGPQDDLHPRTFRPPKNTTTIRTLDLGAGAIYGTEGGLGGMGVGTEVEIIWSRSL